MELIKTNVGNGCKIYLNRYKNNWYGTLYLLHFQDYHAKNSKFYLVHGYKLNFF